jgi:hypothetical protein
MHDQNVRSETDARDRREVALVIVRQLPIERWRDRARCDVALKQRVSVGGRLGCECGSYCSASARAVIDQHLVAPHPGEAFRDQTGDDVGRTASRERDDVADRFRWIGCRICRRRRLAPGSGRESAGEHGEREDEGATAYDHDMHTDSCSITAVWIYRGC